MHQNRPRDRITTMDYTSFESQIAAVLHKQSPPKNLEQKVVQAIFATKNYFWKEFIFGVVSETASASLLVFSVWLLHRAALTAGTGSFMNLFFSDFNIVLGDWHDYVYSFLESFPVWESILVILSIIAVVYFAKRLTKGTKNYFFLIRNKPNALWT